MSEPTEDRHAELPRLAREGSQAVARRGTPDELEAVLERARTGALRPYGGLYIPAEIEANRRSEAHMAQRVEQQAQEDQERPRTGPDVLVRTGSAQGRPKGSLSLPEPCRHLVAIGWCQQCFAAWYTSHGSVGPCASCSWRWLRWWNTGHRGIPSTERCPQCAYARRQALQHEPRARRWTGPVPEGPFPTAFTILHDEDARLASIAEHAVEERQEAQRRTAARLQEKRQAAPEEARRAEEPELTVLFVESEYLAWRDARKADGRPDSKKVYLAHLEAEERDEIAATAHVPEVRDFLAKLRQPHAAPASATASAETAKRNRKLGRSLREAEPEDEDPRYVGASLRHLHATGQERTFTVYADGATRQPIRRQRVCWTPGMLQYTVLARSFQQALWLVDRHVFAASSILPGILTLVDPSTSETLGSALHLVTEEKVSKF